MDFLRRLASTVDRPGFPWKPLVISFTVGQYLFQSYLSYRQYQVLCRKERPKALEKEVDQATFDKSQDYGRAKSRYGFISGAFNQAVDLAILHYDVYPRLWSYAGGLLARWAPHWCSGEIGQSLLFLFILSTSQAILSLPFDYYFNFVLEAKYGFNKQTLGIWISDFFKTQGLSLAFGIPIGSAFLAIIQRTGEQFFYWLYLLMLAVQLFMITIFPIWILPLFNKLTPLEDGSLKKAVEALAAKLKFPLNELQVIDGSKRSAHSNAFFTGLPWKKKIVLFDTLIEKSEEEEVVAVLAHELGHWKMGHTTKQMGIAQVHIFTLFALFSAFIKNRSLYESFGFKKEMPIVMGFILFNEVLGPADSILQLGMNILSRKFEYEADAFGAKLGYARELASSLIKLQIQNLSAMDADWMYSAYTYSHPILTERLRALGWQSDVKISSGPKIGESTSNADSNGVVKASDREL